MTSLQRALIAIAFALTAMIIVVVVVGLVQGKLDPTGTATMLGGLLIGIVGGLLARAKSGDDQ